MKPLSKFGLQFALCASFMLSLFCAVAFAGTWWSLAFTQCDGQRSIFYYIFQNKGFCHDESRGGLPHCTSWSDLSVDKTIPDSASESAALYEQSRYLCMAALVLAACSFGLICTYCYMLYVRLIMPIVRVLGIISSGLSAVLLICALGVSDRDDYFRDVDSYYEESVCSESHSVRNAGYILAICGIVLGCFVSLILLFPVWIFARPPGGEVSAKGRAYSHYYSVVILYCRSHIKCADRCSRQEVDAVGRKGGPLVGDTR